SRRRSLYAPAGTTVEHALEHGSKQIPNHQDRRCDPVVPRGVLRMPGTHLALQRQIPEEKRLAMMRSLIGGEEGPTVQSATTRSQAGSTLRPWPHGLAENRPRQTK